MEGPVAPPPKLPAFKDMIKKKSTGESEAREKASETIKKYTEQYEILKVPAQENESLKKEVDNEKTKTDVLNRLSQLGTSSPASFDWFGIVLDVIIVILGIILVYYGFSKLFSSSTGVVVPESSDVTI